MSDNKPEPPATPEEIGKKLEEFFRSQFGRGEADATRRACNDDNLIRETFKCSFHVRADVQDQIPCYSFSSGSLFFGWLFLPRLAGFASSAPSGFFAPRRRSAAARSTPGGTCSQARRPPPGRSAAV